MHIKLNLGTEIDAFYASWSNTLYNVSSFSLESSFALRLSTVKNLVHFASQQLSCYSYMSIVSEYEFLLFQYSTPQTVPLCDLHNLTALQIL